MSVAEIKEQAAQLSLAERNELTRYLGSLNEEEELKDLLAQRMKRMDAGQAVSLDSFIETHRQMESGE